MRSFPVQHSLAYFFALQDWQILCFPRWRGVGKPGLIRIYAGTCIEQSGLLERTCPCRSTVSTTHLRKKRKIPVQHPVLLPSNWAETIFNYGGHFLMQGKDLSDAGQFSQDLTDFWRNFCATHPDFKLPAAQWDHSIPICLHGDEGRGRLKHPVMVMSLQPLLPLRPGKTNMAGSFDSMIYSAYIPLQSFSLFCFFSGALGTLVYIKRGLTI